MYKSLFALLTITTFLSCTNAPQKLPIYGNKEIRTQVIDGKEVIDTIFQTIPPFSFIDQDSNIITNETFKDKIFIADFVFLSCGSICPKMNVQMKRLYDKYASNPNIVFLTHTIDPERDTLARIKKFMKAHGAETNKWHFVRGPQEEILKIANKGYFSIAYKDSVDVKPGAEYQHEGWFVLVDKKQRIRSMKDGTDQFEVDKLSKDIELLLLEKE
ncbi:MAG: SCO family protein [Bacteroidetes bacterium]|nr:SCO family protein [Bacteroidota bacterium]